MGEGDSAPRSGQEKALPGGVVWGRSDSAGRPPQRKLFLPPVVSPGRGGTWPWPRTGLALGLHPIKYAQWGLSLIGTIADPSRAVVCALVVFSTFPTTANGSRAPQKQTLDMQCPTPWTWRVQPYSKVGSVDAADPLARRGRTGALALSVGGRLRLDSCRSCSFRRATAEANLSSRLGSVSFSSIASTLSNCMRTRFKRLTLNCSESSGSAFSIFRAFACRNRLATCERLAISTAFSLQIACAIAFSLSADPISSSL